MVIQELDTHEKIGHVYIQFRRGWEVGHVVHNDASMKGETRAVDIQQYQPCSSRIHSRVRCHKFTNLSQIHDQPQDYSFSQL